MTQWMAILDTIMIYIAVILTAILKKMK